MKNNSNQIYKAIVALLIINAISNNAFAGNEKRLCLYKGQYYSIGSSNKLYLEAAFSLAARESRKVNIANKSEFTFISLGAIAHINANSVHLGPTLQIQSGFLKFKHLWPTAKYTYLINTNHANRIAIGLSYLPLRNCGINYNYTLFNKQHTDFRISHSIGIVFNLRTKKVACQNTKK